MIQIDMEMPKSCKECPLCGEYGDCSIMPGIPAWVDVSKYEHERSPHCVLKEVKTKHEEFCVPDCCGECKNMAAYGVGFVCHMPQFDSNMNILDISAFSVEPESRPEWCPIVKMNGQLNEMEPKKRDQFDMIMKGMSALLGLGTERSE